MDNVHSQPWRWELRNSRSREQRILTQTCQVQYRPLEVPKRHLIAPNGPRIILKSFCLTETKRCFSVRIVVLSCCASNLPRQLSCRFRPTAPCLTRRHFLSTWTTYLVAVDSTHVQPASPSVILVHIPHLAFRFCQPGRPNSWWLTAHIVNLLPPASYWLTLGTLNFVFVNQDDLARGG